MKPHTLIKLHEATEGETQVYILRLCADAGVWTATVYRAVEEGYLARASQAHYRPTEKLRDYVRNKRWERRGS